MPERDHRSAPRVLDGHDEASVRTERPGGGVAPVSGRFGTSDAAPALRVVAPREADEIVSGDGWPLIPPGSYEAFGVKATRPYQPFGPKGSWKITVIWKVLVRDEHGVRVVGLPRHYNVTRGRDGRVHAGRSSHYRREWVVAAGRRPSRYDRLSPQVFEKIACRVEVETVTRDSTQRPLAPLNQYSKIARVIERTAGGPTC